MLLKPHTQYLQLWTEIPLSQIEDPWIESTSSIHKGDGYKTNLMGGFFILPNCYILSLEYYCFYWRLKGPLWVDIDILQSWITLLDIVMNRSFKFLLSFFPLTPKLIFVRPQEKLLHKQGTWMNTVLKF